MQEKKTQKTNAVRILERAKLAYQLHDYPHSGEAVDAVTAAGLIGKDPVTLFKTLVTRGASGLAVFCIPAPSELDLKKAAVAVGMKSLEMVHVAELFALTGYIRGGCSPIGMKKQYPTFIDESAKSLASICVSAGRIGTMLELSPDALVTVSGAKFAALTR